MIDSVLAQLFTSPDTPFPPEFFRRQDESVDPLFYLQPRLVVHIDDAAIAAIGDFFRQQLPSQGVVLDLMSSWRSHLPNDLDINSLVGLGLNSIEMAQNPQLDDWVVHDLNADPALPFGDDTFDAAVVTVSIQYMVRPVEVFRDMHRVLRPGAGFHVVYSNRMFPTKAVAIWQALDDHQRGGLVAAYFLKSGGWDPPRMLDITTAAPSAPTDPVYVVTAHKPTL